MPRKVFVANEILTAADVNTNLMDQAVMVFDDDAARTAAIPTPSEGMVTYLKDTNLVQAFTGLAFTAVGGILQVVSTTKTDTFSASVASGAFSGNVTDLEATITPSSASSKILVSASVTGSQDDAFGMVGFRLMRDATAISVGDTAGSRDRLTSAGGARTQEGNDIAFVGAEFLDSPATTSAITYGVQLYNTAGDTQNVFLNRSSANTDSGNLGRPTSTITVMEVAG